MTKLESLTKSLAPMGTASFFIFYRLDSIEVTKLVKNKKDIVDSGIKLLIYCFIFSYLIKVTGNNCNFLMNRLRINTFEKNLEMGVADLLFKRKKELAEKNLRDGQDYLVENGKRESVTTLPSGLQYEILVETEGPKPTAKSTVKCHYHGTTITSKVFDSSVKRGKPASFPLNRVIKGWTEGLQLMSVGSKFRFTIPPHLAYGQQEVSKEIGPNSTLVFDVELLEIK